MIYASAVATVGSTPLVESSRLARGLHARIAGKLEMRNLAGSVRDRLGRTGGRRTYDDHAVD
jgi:cysteine synthase